MAIAAHHRLLTPGEVAVLFRVDPKTVNRWAKAGKLTAIRTLGGHRRYPESEVRALLNGLPTQRDGAATPDAAPTDRQVAKPADSAL